MLRVEVMSGPQDGQVVLCERPELWIGSQPECDLYLAHDPHVPPGAIVIRCHESELSTEEAGISTPLVPGELLRVGVTLVRVLVE